MFLRWNWRDGALVWVWNFGNNSDISYDKIYSNNVKDQIEVFRRMEKNLEKRKIIKELEIPGDPISDLLHASSFGWNIYI